MALDRVMSSTMRCPRHPDGDLAFSWSISTYGAEACAAALDWFADVLPGERVVLRSQTANGRSMRLAARLGFTEVERYQGYGAEQWLGVWSSVSPSG